jgi:hypothetical protein
VIEINICETLQIVETDDGDNGDNGTMGQWGHNTDDTSVLYSPFFNR